MKPFRFRLQRVLDVRAQIRDKARQEVVLLNHERDHAISILRGLEDEYQDIQIPEGGTYPASQLMLSGAYAERLEKAITEQQQVVAQAIKDAQAAQERYIEASREAKALEMLREKKVLEHKEQAQREEGSTLDEFAIQRAMRVE